jgi:hypothetical protein
MLNITYGFQAEADYFTAGESIAQSVQRGKFWQVSRGINRAFFGGGALKPKRFSTLFSFHKPVAPTCTVLQDEVRVVEIRKKYSVSKVIGYFEGIPFIDPLIAAVNCVAHAIGMIHSYARLRKAVKALNAVTNEKIHETAAKTDAVFTAAVKFTIHQNRMVGSLLSLIPLLKPITRLAQGAIFHIKKA